MHESQADLLRSLDPAALGARIRAAREARGWTQGQLAGHDLSPGYLSRIEHGVRRPTLAVLQVIAERLDTSADRFLRGPAALVHDQVRLELDQTELALASGDAAEAADRARRARDAAHAAGLVDLELRAGLLAARGAESLGDHVGAIADYETVLQAATGVTALRAGTGMCRCYRETGDLALAADLGARLMRLAAIDGLEQTGDAVLLAGALAAVHAERGDITEAMRVSAAAVRQADRLGSVAERAAAYRDASVVHAQRGDVTGALELTGRALALVVEGEDDRHLANLRVQLGRLQLQTDEPDVPEVVAQLVVAREGLVAAAAPPVDVAAGDVVLAQAHLRAGDPVRAAEVAARAAVELPEGSAVVRAEAYLALAQADAAMGDADGTRAACTRAEDQLTAAEQTRHTAQLWFDLADLLRGLGDLEGAIDALRRAGGVHGLRIRSTRAPSAIR